MNGEQPLVSICLPLYNGERYLREALDGIIAQTYRPLELVVSDDRSKDDSLAIVEEYRSKTDIEVRVLHHEPAGIGANWNHCVRAARGAYIKFVFQDDLITPDCVAKLMAVALEDEEVGMVFCRRTLLIDPNNAEHTAWAEKYRNLHTGWGRLDRVNSGKQLLAHPDLLKIPRNKIGEPPATLLKKEVFDRVGYFREDLKQALDYEFYYRLMTRFKVGFVDEELFTFRLHGEQATAVNARSGNHRSEKVRLRRLFYEELGEYLAPSVRWELAKEFHPVLGGVRRLLRWGRGLSKE